jgi:hypothetical protein
MYQIPLCQIAISGELSYHGGPYESSTLYPDFLYLSDEVKPRWIRCIRVTWYAMSTVHEQRVNAKHDGAFCKGEIEEAVKDLPRTKLATLTSSR